MIMCKMSSPPRPPKKFPFCHHITAGSGCLERCCRLPLTQHSCGCSVKKASPVKEELSSKTASLIASYPLHKASLSFPTQGGEKKPGRFRKKFFTSPPLLLLLRPHSGPTPPPSSSLLCESFPLFCSARFLSTVTRTNFPIWMWLAFTVLLTIIFPLALANTPLPAPHLCLPIPLPSPFLPFLLPGTIWSRACAPLHSFTQPLTDTFSQWGSTSCLFERIRHTPCLLVNRNITFSRPSISQ